MQDPLRVSGSQGFGYLARNIEGRERVKVRACRRHSLQHATQRPLIGQRHGIKKLPVKGFGKGGGQHMRQTQGGPRLKHLQQPPYFWNQSFGNQAHGDLLTGIEGLRHIHVACPPLPKQLTNFQTLRTRPLHALTSYCGLFWHER